MAEAVNYFEKLRNIADKLHVHCNHVDTEDVTTLMQAAAEIKQLAAEVERLTPKPMTLSEATLILNTERYREINTWWRDLDDDEFIFNSRGPSTLYSYEAIAVAERLLREKEAARG